MIYFTSDLHFYHDNIIRHTNRPYHGFEEMIMIRNLRLSSGLGLCRTPVRVWGK
jgi:calcineurin-like phosphoesterase family protein